jgi:O-antigen/teichoic acid export membrane protein
LVTWKKALNINKWLRNFKGDGIDAVLTKGTARAIAVKLGGAGIGFVVLVLLARVLGIEQYGQYAYVISWLMILALPCKLGMETTLVRFLAAYRARKQWDLLFGIIQFAKRSTLFTSIIVACITALVIWGIRSRIGTSFTLTFWLGCAALPILTMLHVRQSALRAFRHVFMAGAPESLIQPLLLLLLVIIFGIFIKIPLNGPLVMIFHGATLFLALLVTSKWLSRPISQVPQTEIVKTNSREWLAVSLPLLMMAGFSLIIQRADIIMVGLYLGTTKAGIYIAAVRLSNLLILGLTAANFIAAPLISELHAQGKKSELQIIISKVALGVCALTLPAAAAMVIFSSRLLRLFGSGFENGLGSLLILIGGQSVNALFGPVGYLLTMTGYHRQAALIMGSTACANLIMNAILIPVIGLAGAAFATTLSTVIWNVLMWIQVHRYLYIEPTILSVFRNKR